MAENKKKKIFVVSGFHFHPDEHEHDIITEVFKTREKAAKRIFDILTETFPDDAGDFTLKALSTQSVALGVLWLLNEPDFSYRRNIDKFQTIVNPYL